jgi:hypothetical protein
MNVKKESTQKRNKDLAEDVKLLQAVRKSPGYIVDKLMAKYKISFGTLTNILRHERIKLDTQVF